MNPTHVAAAWNRPKDIILSDCRPSHALLSVSLLGGLTVTPATSAENYAGASMRFPTRYAALLFAYLLCFPDRRPTREALSELLWPDKDFDYGRKNLSLTITRLRKHLSETCPGAEEAVDTSDRTRLALRPELLLSGDRDLLERSLVRVESEPDAGELLSEARWVSDLYAGPLLDGYDEIWIVAQRERLQERCVTALRRALRVAYDLQAVEVASDIARCVLRIEPTRESAHRDLIRLLLLQGRVGPARRQMEELERTLRDQGVQPTRPTHELAEQLGIAIAAPMTQGADSARTSPVPIAVTRFFGRDEEQREIAEILSGDGTETPRTRLVTLLGPGGNGKTRLAREVALSLHADLQSPFAGSVWWLSLSDVSDVDSLLIQLKAMVRNRNPEEGSGSGGREGSPLDLAATALTESCYRSGRQALLVLDNAETHLAAGARIVRSLLERVPTLSCLVTSRLPLGVAGEQEFLVEPLSSPELPPLYGEMDLDRLHTTPSVQLFVDRMQTVQRRFHLGKTNAAAIARLCSWLDGSPLAIELAASWGRTLSPQQILDRLQGRRFDVLVSQDQETPDRHRSLGAIIETTESLLSPDASRLFHQLSVFRGGFTLEAAEVVCDRLDREGTHSFLHRFHELTSVAFVTPLHDTGRFRLLEPLREWGYLQLLPRERLQLRRRHAYYYATVDFVCNAPTLQQILHSAATDEQQGREADNLLAAWEYFQESSEEEDIGLGLQFAIYLYEWLYRRGYQSQMRDRLLRQLERAEEVRAAISARSSGSVSPAWLEELMRTLLMLCRREQVFNVELSLQLLEQVERLAQTHPVNLDLRASILLMHGVITEKDPELRRSYYEKAISLCEAENDTAVPAYLRALCFLSDWVYVLGDYRNYHDLAVRCCQIAHALEERGTPPPALQWGQVLFQRARAEMSRRELASAHHYLREAALVFKNSGDLRMALFTKALDADWHELAGDDATAAILARRTIAEHEKYDSVQSTKSALEVLTRVTLRDRLYRYTAQLMGAWEALIEAYKVFPGGFTEDQEMIDMREKIISHIGTAAHKAAWLEGRALTVPDIIALSQSPSTLERDMISIDPMAAPPA